MLGHSALTFLISVNNCLINFVSKHSNGKKLIARCNFSYSSPFPYSFVYLKSLVMFLGICLIAKCDLLLSKKCWVVLTQF